jgi:hypothetical protein
MKNITKNRNYYRALVKKAEFDLSDAINHMPSNGDGTNDISEIKECISARNSWSVVLDRFEDLEEWADGSLTEAELNRVHSVIMGSEHQPGDDLIGIVKEIRLTRWQQALTQYLQKSIASGDREAEDMDTQFAIDTLMRLSEDDLMYDLCDQPDTKTDTLEEQISTWEEKARYQAKWAVKKSQKDRSQPEDWDI